MVTAEIIDSDIQPVPIIRSHPEIPQTLKQQIYQRPAACSARIQVRTVPPVTCLPSSPIHRSIRPACLLLGFEETHLHTAPAGSSAQHASVARQPRLRRSSTARRRPTQRRSLQAPAIRHLHPTSSVGSVRRSARLSSPSRSNYIWRLLIVVGVHLEAVFSNPDLSVQICPIQKQADSIVPVVSSSSAAPIGDTSPCLTATSSPVRPHTADPENPSAKVATRHPSRRTSATVRRPMPDRRLSSPSAIAADQWRFLLLGRKMEHRMGCSSGARNSVHPQAIFLGTPAVHAIWCTLSRLFFLVLLRLVTSAVGPTSVSQSMTSAVGPTSVGQQWVSSHIR
ncbi:hypothetical protein ACLOJK_010407 [Asimina triloba]